MAVALVAGIAAVVTIFSDQIIKLNILEEYQMERILVWKDPTQYALEGGHQVLQGLYAIGSGGLFGKGLGKSMQKLGFVPESQNDMIFSIICEELGLFGAGFILILFLILIWRFFVIATHAGDLFGALIAAGAMGHMMIQVILNIAVVTNTIPNTGITLPFISYGGTSVLFFSKFASRLIACMKLYLLEPIVTKHSARAANKVSFAFITTLFPFIIFTPFLRYSNSHIQFSHGIHHSHRIADHYRFFCASLLHSHIRIREIFDCPDFLKLLMMFYNI